MLTQDGLLRVLCVGRAPSHGAGVVTLHVTFSLGLPGLSEVDRFGATWAFEWLRFDVDGDGSLRQYVEGQDAEDLIRDLKDDFRVGRTVLEKWANPDAVLSAVMDGRRISGHSRSIEISTACGWATMCAHHKLPGLLDLLRQEAKSEVFLQDHLAAIRKLAGQGPEEL